MTSQAFKRDPIPSVPEEVLLNNPKVWGIGWFPEDRAVPAPRLLAVRYWRDGGCQALYQTAENPKTGGRGFIVDSRTGFGGEHTLAAILSRQGSWHWEFRDAGIGFVRSARAAASNTP